MTVPLRRLRLAHLGIAVAVLIMSFLAAPPAKANDQVGIPVLAYYYIWYQATSWDRAKKDLPLLGRYSSDEWSVMLKHAEEAKSAGLDGFLVSWKNTPDLDRRLAMLVRVAQQTGLKLGIVYQGLDFYRRPLPAARVASDLTWFTHEYGTNPVFDVFGPPLVIWSGTWEFTPRQVRRVAHQAGRGLTLLATERDAESYQRLAPYVAGDAYYWSSLDPSRDVDAQDRLDALGNAVHAHGGLWLPSAAPGFDATLLGGERVVRRYGGQTLRHEWQLAIDSSPDAVGIISWNEFSENTHIEPSRNYGNESLRALAAILSATVPASIAGDSSDPGPGNPGGPPYRAIALLLVGAALVPGSLAMLARSRGREPKPPPEGGTTPMAGVP